jgi:hypothetical protein
MSRQNPILRFEAVDSVAAGHSLNRRVCAVYELQGFIHQTFLNDANHQDPKSCWEYFGRGGVVTGLRSEVSLEALKSELGCEAPDEIESEPREIFKLYVGLSKSDGRIIQTDEVYPLLDAYFESYTATESRGHFKGSQEPVVVITVAANNRQLVIQVARELRQKLLQEGVGIEHSGHYERITQ